MHNECRVLYNGTRSFQNFILKRGQRGQQFPFSINIENKLVYKYCSQHLTLVHGIDGKDDREMGEEGNQKK